MLFETLCPAKINLFLHILGKREDNYHILESLVTFADFGDELSFRASGEPLSLVISGVYAHDLSGFDVNDNLIVKAARLFAERFNVEIGGEFRLVKNLPVASGIGGGSSNAAMAVRLLMQAYDVQGDVNALLLKLGSDVPVCFGGRNVIMSGTGEDLYEWPGLPELYAVLVNPNVAVSTGKIFDEMAIGYDVGGYEFTGLAVPEIADVREMVAFLKMQRNDMQSAALSICPEIGEVLEALNASDEVIFAQMSGSGATCFGIFATAEQAQTAAEKLAKLHPMWWVKSTIFSG